MKTALTFTVALAVAVALALLIRVLVYAIVDAADLLPSACAGSSVVNVSMPPVWP